MTGRKGVELIAVTSKMLKVIWVLILILAAVVAKIETRYNKPPPIWHPHSYLRTALVSCLVMYYGGLEKCGKILHFARRTGIGGRIARRRTARGPVAVGDIASRDSVLTDYRDRDGDDSGKFHVFNN